MGERGKRGIGESGNRGIRESGTPAPGLPFSHAPILPLPHSPTPPLKFRVGTSGWHYRHWRDVFYPGNLPTKAWLAFYAERFSTVEVNNSFYRLPSESAMLSWREQTPPGFVFALKASRKITHFKRLLNANESLDRFFARARLLGDKLGPVLYQLPASMARNDERLESFLDILPRDVAHAVEFRHLSWVHEDVFGILERYGVALCAVDAPGLRIPLVLTAPHAYVRFHGPAGMYAGLYSDEYLHQWALRLHDVADNVHTVYAYFNNDDRGYAVTNAQQLLTALASKDA
jgi:uncharacterized protein YecE (DUF72 family)